MRRAVDAVVRVIRKPVHYAGDRIRVLADAVEVRGVGLRVGVYNKDLFAVVLGQNCSHVYGGDGLTDAAF